MDVWWNRRRKESVYFNITVHELKALKKVIITETFNVDFHNKFIKFWIILFFSTFLYTVGFNFLIYFHIETRLTKAWTAINRLLIIWKSDLTDKMKRSFFQAAVTSILLSGCTTWTLTKRLEKELDGNYTRMLHVILNKFWWQHPTRHQLYGHLPPITKSIQVRRTRHAGHCWRSRDELIRDVLIWTATHGRAKAGRPARTYIQPLCEDTGCCPEDLPRAMNDRGGVAREGQRYLCYQRNMMMMMMIYIYIYIHHHQSRCKHGFHTHTHSLSLYIYIYFTPSASMIYRSRSVL